MNRVFCLGNGESRKGVNLDLLKPYGKIYGCNALYRDFTPDVLVAVDQGITHEIYQSGYAYTNECYFRNWYPQDEKNYLLSVYGTTEKKMIDFIDTLNLKTETEKGNSKKFVVGGPPLYNFAKQVMKNKSKLDEYRGNFTTNVTWVNKDKVKSIKEVDASDLPTNSKPLSLLGNKGEEAMSTGFIGSIAGFNVYYSDQIDEDVSSGGDAAGFAMSAGAVGLGIGPDGLFRIETERNASFRSTEYVGVGFWGETEIKDAFGVYILSDVS